VVFLWEFIAGLGCVVNCVLIDFGFELYFHIKQMNQSNVKQTRHTLKALGLRKHTCALDIKVSDVWSWMCSVTFLFIYLFRFVAVDINKYLKSMFIWASHGPVCFNQRCSPNLRVNYWSSQPAVCPCVSTFLPLERKNHRNHTLRSSNGGISLNYFF